MRRNLEESRKFFCQDKYALTTKINIDEVADFYAKCSFKIEEFHTNVAGNVMGGAIFTLADYCFAVASDAVAVSTTSNITYLAPAKGTTLIAEAKMIKDGRTTVFYEIEVSDDLGRKVAFVTMSGMKLG